MDKNCLTCKRFVDCTNKKRRYDFVCSKYTPKLITSVSLDDFGDKTTSIDHFKFDPDKQEDFDIFSLIDSLTDSENVLPRDVKIDDRDIPQAPNFFEFATDPRFLAVTPFPKQVEVASNYFNEICWKCSNREWKKGFPTSCTMEDIRENIQFFDKGVCPKCGRRKSVQIRKEKMRPYVQLAGLCGQRSGKSATFDMMEAYRLHWCLKIPKLAQFYGLLPSSQLHTSYVALTFGQAKETIYDTLYDYMTTSPWWQSYREMLDYYGNKYGEELYTIKDTFFRFRTQSITGYPAGPDRRKLRGRTRCSGAIDEIGWFLAAQAGTIKYDVDEIHKAMLNSFKTVHAATRKLYEQGYDNVLNPILANISSPSSVNDKIMRLYEQSKTSHYIYGFRYASWEFNPTLSEDDFIDEKINQPKEFMRDYMTIPPLSSNPFIEDVEQVGPCLTSNDNAFTLTTDKITTKSGRVMSGAKIQRKWVGKSNKILALDAGLNNNSFAICLGHNEEVTIDGIKHLFPVYDCLAEAIPEKNCPINFSSMYNNVIKPIIEEYGVRLVVADRWNSAKVLDDIETDFGVKVETYSVKYSDFSTFKEMILNNQIKFPRCEGSYKNVSPDVVDYPFGFIGKPIQHFILQCITVQDFGDKSVTKGDGYTDDIFRATVLANSYLVDKDYKNMFVGETIKRGGGAVGSRGDGGTLSSNLGARPTGYSTSTSYISRG